MIAVGKKIKWPKSLILDKHCVGGLPGNRTTPIVVSIVAAAGLIIPKTSSRAITSPAGTADTMETMAPVNLSIDKIQKVVSEHGGCIAWGGAVMLSPADDLLIAVERALDIDSSGQMVASVLSKKVAAGSTHVVIDIPVGPTAKVRTHEEALKLQYYFKAVSEAIGIYVEVIITEGIQPVGRGIGPSLEAMDVLSVLQNKIDAPADLKERAITLSAALLVLSGKFAAGTELKAAQILLENGSAYEKFKSICIAQGGFKEPGLAKFRFDVIAENNGEVRAIDNRKLARIAKLAGAPKQPCAGVFFNAPVGKKIKKGDLLFSIYAELEAELEYAVKYFNSLNDLIDIR
jgi:thymidine phosphorylase